MLDPTIDRIIKEISEETKISQYEVQEVVLSEFRKVVEAMRENRRTNGNGITILLNFFGKFKVKEGRKKYLDSFKSDFG
jgi:nucleoid DNA-binding protein